MNYLALDLGAGSGRAILGTIKDRKLQLKEILRFENESVQLNNTIYWNFLSLFSSIKKSIALAQKDYDIKGIAVDTWGVDFGLIDKSGKLIANPVSYRDARSEGTSKEVLKLISKEELYRISGIQLMEINTLFQLYALQKENDSVFEITNKLLFIPDLVNYFLTGKMANEYTIASTSQLLNAQTRNWETSLFQKLNIPQQIMGKVIHPGECLGNLSKKIIDETNAKEANVFAICSHDTASAIGAIPDLGNDCLFLSSGTWSLLGIVSEQPILTEKALLNDFTNEGGADNKILFMRNITGLWLLQCLIAEWEKEKKEISYSFLLEECAKATAFRSIINSDNDLFFNASSMTKAIQSFCLQSGQELPHTQGEFVRCVLESLALKYYHVVEKLKECSGRKFNRLQVVGGGSLNEELNQFIANALNVTVVTGLTEATAIGNIMQQAISDGVVASWNDAHEIIKNSFNFKSYHPMQTEQWATIIEKTKKYFT